MQIRIAAHIDPIGVPWLMIGADLSAAPNDASRAPADQPDHPA